MRSSQKLDALFQAKVSDGEEEEEPALGWKCFALSHKDSIYIFVVPPYFCRSPKEGERSETDGPSSFVLPVVLLHCNQEVLMDPDPAQQAPHTRHPDVYEHLPLSVHHTITLHTPQQTQRDDHLTALCSTLQTVHFSSYLRTLHSALNHSKSVPPSDFLAGLGICEESVFSVDLTPLVAALCQHSTVKLRPTVVPEQEPLLAIGCSPPLPPQMLCHLLSSVSMRASSFCRLFKDGEAEEEEKEELKGAPPHCQNWKAEIEQAFRGYLAELGLTDVPLCGGYYWLKPTGVREAQLGRNSPKRKVCVGLGVGLSMGCIEVKLQPKLVKAQQLCAC